MAHSSILPDTIDGKAVQSLVEARAIRGATVLGQPGGWAVLVRYGALERAVSAQRARKPRLWRNLATAATFVRDELGVTRFEVDTLNHEPDADRRCPPRMFWRVRIPLPSPPYPTAACSLARKSPNPKGGADQGRRPPRSRRKASKLNRSNRSRKGAASAD